MYPVFENKWAICGKKIEHIWCSKKLKVALAWSVIGGTISFH